MTILYLFMSTKKVSGPQEFIGHNKKACTSAQVVLSLTERCAHSALAQGSYIFVGVHVKRAKISVIFKSNKNADILARFGRFLGTERSDQFDFFS